MKIGLVGYSGGGKSTLFELLTGTKPDPGKVQTGQVGIAIVPDERFERLVAYHKPKKTVPARIELFDTPGLSREDHSVNPQRLGVIREAAALVQVIGVFAGSEPLAEAEAFQEDLVLADLQVVTNRVERLQKDVLKPRPDRDKLQEELDLLAPIHAALEEGRPLRDFEFSREQDKVCRSFALLTRKPGLVVLNTLDSDFDPGMVEAFESRGMRALAAPVGLELEVQALPEEERAVFAAEMGLGEPCRDRLLKAIFAVTDQIIFYTSDQKEVHAWLLPRGATALDAADAIHSDLARGFIRAEVYSVDNLFRLGSEREVKAAGLYHVEGKDYIVRDGDEIVIRSGV